MKKNLPDLQFHTKLQDFFNNPNIELWIKMLHFFIITDTKSTGKDGYTIWYQNPFLQKKFTVRDADGKLVFKPSMSNVQKSIAKLETLKLLDRTVSTTGERRIKLNRAMVIHFLREYDLTSDTYQSYRIKSRERKLIRKKIITIVDYVNAKKISLNEQYKQYLDFQHRKYGYTITDSAVEIYQIDPNANAIITQAEFEMYKKSMETDKLLDAIWNKMPAARY